MVNKRQIALLEILLNSDRPITSQQLAKALDVSSRTIRSDMDALHQALNAFPEAIKAKNPDGYWIQTGYHDALRHLIETFKQPASSTHLPQTPSERMTYILVQLLLSERMSMQTLSDLLYVTKTTISHDIHQLNSELSEGLDTPLITTSSKGICLSGDEFEIRWRSAQWLTRNQNRMNPLIQSMDLIIPNNQFAAQSVALYQLIVRVIEQHQVYLADHEVQYLMIYLMLSLLRHPKQPMSAQPPSEPTAWINDILEVAERTLAVQWTNDEVNATIAFSKALGLVRAETVKQDNIELITVLDRFLNDVKTTYDLDFTENTALKQFLYVHLRSMFHRLVFNEVEFNPLKEDIKKKFPLATEVAFLLFTRLRDEKGLIMNDSEISYIALHLASALEVMIEPTRVVLVSNLGQGATRLLATKLVHCFANKIALVHQWSQYQYEAQRENGLDQIDLVVSTTTLSPVGDLPIVKVNPLLFRDDIAHLKRYIHFYSMAMRNRSRFSELFDERLFYRVSAANNRYDAIIRFLVKQLKTFDYIEDEEDYTRLVMEREKTYSTIMDNGIAIPHAAENKARKTVIAVAVLDEPLLSDGKPVRIVLLNAINEKEDLQGLYQMIEHILNADDLNDAVAARDLDTFIKSLGEHKGEN